MYVLFELLYSGRLFAEFLSTADLVVPFEASWLTVLLSLWTYCCLVEAEELSLLADVTEVPVPLLLVAFEPSDAYWLFILETEPVAPVLAFHLEERVLGRSFLPYDTISLPWIPE